MNNLWQAPSDDLQLSPEYIDIWRVGLDLPDPKVDVLSEVLSEEEIARARKFVSRQKAREFTVTRSTLRTILGKTLDRDPRKLVFQYTTGGKPVLKTEDHACQVQFSVSHSHDLALIAVTLDTGIGIDIEKLRTDIDYKKLSRRFFSEKEHELLEMLDQKTQLPAFFATWTRKEAVVKAIGSGIASGLKAFDVSVDPHKPPRLLTLPATCNGTVTLSLLEIDTDMQYVATLATLDPDRQPSCLRHWDFKPFL